jgi:hypothetical protein
VEDKDDDNVDALSNKEEVFFFFFIYIYKINFINRKKTVQKYERVYLKKYKDKPLIIGPPVSGKEELFMYMVWPS